ncbi:MAG: glycosyltransferase family 2 protein [Phycisphaerales bacterium]|nr:glycosyltransferase family 2 protein [Phycisphaerales bacterium]
MLGNARAPGESDKSEGPRPDPPRGPADHPPLVSVVIPTFNRPWLLSRAIESVIGQTEHRWELIISDDEAFPAAGRWMAESYAASDPRIRVVVNHGPHGQCGNLNNAMAHARADWIKPLFDDDLLRPDCLRAMLSAVRGRPGVVLARCLADHYTGERPRRLHRPGRLPAIQSLDGESARLAMLIQDVEIGMPTQVLVRAEVVRAGVRMEAPEGVVIGVDWWWFARLLQHGDLILVNLGLAEEHQGDHATVTSKASTDILYDEMRRLRRDVLTLIPEPLRPADTRAAEGVVSLVQAACDLRAGEVIAALRRAALVRSPGAWALTARLFLRRLLPGRFERIPRQRHDLSGLAGGGAEQPPASPVDMLSPSCPPALSASRS